MKTASYPFSDGSTYHFRIIDGKYQEKLENPVEGETEASMKKKLTEAMDFFITTGKLTWEEFDEHVNYAGYFDEFSNKRRKKISPEG